MSTHQIPKGALPYAAGIGQVRRPPPPQAPVPFSGIGNPRQPIYFSQQIQAQQRALAQQKALAQQQNAPQQQQVVPQPPPPSQQQTAQTSSTPPSGTYYYYAPNSSGQLVLVSSVTTNQANYQSIISSWQQTISQFPNGAYISFVAAGGPNPSAGSTVYAIYNSQGVLQGTATNLSNVPNITGTSSIKAIGYAPSTVTLSGSSILNQLIQTPPSKAQGQAFQTFNQTASQINPIQVQTASSPGGTPQYSNQYILQYGGNTYYFDNYQQAAASLQYLSAGVGNPLQLYSVTNGGATVYFSNPTIANGFATVNSQQSFTSQLSITPASGGGYNVNYNGKPITSTPFATQGQAQEAESQYESYSLGQTNTPPSWITFGGDTYVNSAALQGALTQNLVNTAGNNYSLTINGETLLFNSLSQAQEAIADIISGQVSGFAQAGNYTFTTMAAANTYAQAINSLNQVTNPYTPGTMQYLRWNEAQATAAANFRNMEIGQLNTEYINNLAISNPAILPGTIQNLKYNENILTGEANAAQVQAYKTSIKNPAYVNYLAQTNPEELPGTIQNLKLNEAFRTSQSPLNNQYGSSNYYQPPGAAYFKQVNTAPDYTLQNSKGLTSGGIGLITPLTGGINSSTRIQFSPFSQEQPIIGPEPGAKVIGTFGTGSAVNPLVSPVLTTKSSSNPYLSFFENNPLVSGISGGLNTIQSDIFNSNPLSKAGLATPNAYLGAVTNDLLKSFSTVGSGARGLFNSIANNPYGGAIESQIANVSAYNAGIRAQEISAFQQIPVSLNKAANYYNSIGYGAPGQGGKISAFNVATGFLGGFSEIGSYATRFLNPNASYKNVYGNFGEGVFNVESFAIQGLALGEVAAGADALIYGGRVTGTAVSIGQRLGQAGIGAAIGAAYGAPSGNLQTTATDALLFGGVTLFAEPAIGAVSRAGKGVVSGINGLGGAINEWAGYPLSDIRSLGVLAQRFENPTIEGDISLYGKTSLSKPISSAPEGVATEPISESEAFTQNVAQIPNKPSQSYLNRLLGGNFSKASQGTFDWLDTQRITNVLGMAKTGISVGEEVYPGIVRSNAISTVGQDISIQRIANSDLFNFNVTPGEGAEVINAGIPSRTVNLFSGGENLISRVTGILSHESVHGGIGNAIGTDYLEENSVTNSILNAFTGKERLTGLNLLENQAQTGFDFLDYERLGLQEQLNAASSTSGVGGLLRLPQLGYGSPVSQGGLPSSLSDFFSLGENFAGGISVPEDIALNPEAKLDYLIKHNAPASQIQAAREDVVAEFSTSRTPSYMKGVSLISGPGRSFVAIKVPDNIALDAQAKFDYLVANKAPSWQINEALGDKIQEFATSSLPSYMRDINLSNPTRYVAATRNIPIPESVRIEGPSSVLDYLRTNNAPSSQISKALNDLAAEAGEPIPKTIKIPTSPSSAYLSRIASGNFNKVSSLDYFKNFYKPITSPIDLGNGTAGDVIRGIYQDTGVATEGTSAEAAFKANVRPATTSPASSYLSRITSGDYSYVRPGEFDFLKGPTNFVNPLSGETASPIGNTLGQIGGMRGNGLLTSGLSLGERETFSIDQLFGEFGVNPDQLTSVNGGFRNLLKSFGLEDIATGEQAGTELTPASGSGLFGTKGTSGGYRNPFKPEGEGGTSQGQAGGERTQLILQKPETVTETKASTETQQKTETTQTSTTTTLQRQRPPKYDYFYSFYATPAAAATAAPVVRGQQMRQGYAQNPMTSGMNSLISGFIQQPQIQSQTALATRQSLVQQEKQSFGFGTDVTQSFLQGFQQLQSFQQVSGQQQKAAIAQVQRPVQEEQGQYLFGSLFGVGQQFNYAQGQQYRYQFAQPQVYQFDQLFQYAQIPAYVQVPATTQLPEETTLPLYDYGYAFGQGGTKLKPLTLPIKPESAYERRVTKGKGLGLKYNPRQHRVSEDIFADINASVSGILGGNYSKSRTQTQKFAKNEGSMYNIRMPSMGITRKGPSRQSKSRMAETPHVNNNSLVSGILGGISSPRKAPAPKSTKAKATPKRRKAKELGVNTSIIDGFLGR